MKHIIVKEVDFQDDKVTATCSIKNTEYEYTIHKAPVAYETESKSLVVDLKKTSWNDFELITCQNGDVVEKSFLTADEVDIIDKAIKQIMLGQVRLMRQIEQ